MGTIIYKKKDAAMTVTENRMLPCDVTGLFLECEGFPKINKVFP